MSDALFSNYFEELLLLLLFRNLCCVLQWYIWCYVCNAPSCWRSHYTARL